MDRLVFFGSFNKSLFAHLHKDKDDVHPSLKEEWIEYRHKIWRKYTWNSIQRQKNPNWTYVLGCHADTRYLIEKYFADIKDERLMIIYTDEEKKHVGKMAKTADTIILCRIDSDDMYHPNVADVILNDPYKTEWGYFPRGYALEIEWLNVFEWNCHGVGPFFFHRYKSQEFAKLEKFEEPPHRRVGKHDPKKYMNGMFMVLIHDKNTSTNMSLKNLTKTFDFNDQIQILREFNVSG